MKKYIFIVLLVLLNSCKDKYKFDKVSWEEHSDLMRYPNRKYIIDDLIKNYKLKGKSYREILELLGKPFPAFDFHRDTTMLYPIDIKFGKKNELIYTKALSLKITNDSIIQSFKVTESKK